MLQDGAVRHWLGAVEPAWTLLDLASLDALRRPPSAYGAVRLAGDSSAKDVEHSAISQCTRTLLQAASTGAGLKLTSTGNLARSVVGEMISAFLWPGFDTRYKFRLHKVINEPDFLPLFFVRHIAEGARLLRKQGSYLRLTGSARSLLDATKCGALLPLLFHTAFWRLSLTYLARGLHNGWPQQDVGVVLWCLSVAATDWQTPERLTRLCTVPIDSVLKANWDTGSLAMEARVLQPLVWFGLMEHRETKIDGSEWGAVHQYQKTPLFDRLLTFNVALKAVIEPEH